ncbi:MAG: F0F1 ATP synthase subunit B [Tepidanaerobacteraceae bacterium]|jgi:F-type H+-transporting ATPase subunit b|nr:F0F1 ATP synthase subunit B [Tepidanaerobacteraceae bacterium]
MINVFTMIFQLVNVFVLFYFLKKFFYKPLGEFLERRRKKLESLFAEAENRKKEAEQLYEDYKAKLDNASSEARAIIEQAKKEAAAFRREIIQNAKMEAENIAAESRREIERQKSVAFSELRGKAAEMSIMIASKILEEKLSPEDHRRLINRVIERMDERQWLQ